MKGFLDLSEAQLRAFDAWRREPTTIAGFAALVSSVGAVLSGHATWGSAAPVMAGAVIAMILRENPPASKL